MNLWGEQNTFSHHFMYTMPYEIQTEINIEAPAMLVFQVLADFATWKEWNPFIIQSHGVCQEGSSLKHVMKLQNTQMVIKPILTKVIQGKELEWRGKLFISGVFDGQHYFKLEEVSLNQTRLIHGEYFSGILVSFLMKRIGKDTRGQFVAMNQALKQRAEKLFHLHQV